MSGLSSTKCRSYPGQSTLLAEPPPSIHSYTSRNRDGLASLSLFSIFIKFLLLIDGITEKCIPTTLQDTPGDTHANQSHGRAPTQAANMVRLVTCRGPLVLPYHPLLAGIRTLGNREPRRGLSGALDSDGRLHRHPRVPLHLAPLRTGCLNLIVKAAARARLAWHFHHSSIQAPLSSGQGARQGLVPLIMSLGPHSAAGRPPLMSLVSMCQR